MLSAVFFKMLPCHVFGRTLLEFHFTKAPLLCRALKGQRGGRRDSQQAKGCLTGPLSDALTGGSHNPFFLTRGSLGKPWGIGWAQHAKTVNRGLRATASSKSGRCQESKKRGGEFWRTNPTEHPPLGSCGCFSVLSLKGIIKSRIFLVWPRIT